MNKVRVGFIGAGRISTLHALAYENNPTGELVAVADTDESVARAQAAAWGVNQVFKDYRVMLASPEIDAVEILLPHNLHLPVTLDALAAGKHVSLQKPMCINMDEARAIVEAANGASVTFRMVENYRTYEPYMRARDLIDADEIGDLLGMRVKTIHGTAKGGIALALRRELAKERGVPPYLIFNDRTLAAMARARPKTEAELLEVKGVGEKKAADLGPAFLEAITAARA